MVGLGLALGVCGLLYWLLAVRRRAPPTDRWLLFALVLAGPASVVTMEAGWFVTEFGRQPWIVYGVMRTSAAATSSPALGPTFVIFILLYVAPRHHAGTSAPSCLARRERDDGRLRRP